MDLDPDTFLTTVYVEIDTFCAQHPAPVAWHQRARHARLDRPDVPRRVPGPALAQRLQSPRAPPGGAGDYAAARPGATAGGVGGMVRDRGRTAGAAGRVD